VSAYAQLAHKAAKKPFNLCTGMYMLQHAFICMGRMGGELSTQNAEPFGVPQYACLHACHQTLLSRYFDQPAKVKAGFPTTDLLQIFHYDA
jgi:hypothetical protein